MELYYDLTYYQYLEQKGIIVKHSRLFPKCTTCGVSYPDFPELQKCLICRRNLRHKPRKRKVKNYNQEQEKTFISQIQQ